MICSVLIPSRARPKKLARCLDSIRNTTRTENVEIIVRIDSDDQASLDAANYLRLVYGVFIIIGERGDGWNDNNKMFDEMIRIQNGDWCAFFNDDMTVEGEGWDKELAMVPTRGYLVHPEILGIGGARYPNCGGGNFPIAPKYCWREYGWPQLSHPVDAGLNDLLVTRNHWKNWFLKDTKFLHDRDEMEIIQHRK